jgi:hypothetical protein
MGRKKSKEREKDQFSVPLPQRFGLTEMTL